jgi:hypothetical protein
MTSYYAASAGPYPITLALQIDELFGAVRWDGPFSGLSVGCPLGGRLRMAIGRSLVGDGHWAAFFLDARGRFRGRSVGRPFFALSGLGMGQGSSFAGARWAGIFFWG